MTNKGILWAALGVMIACGPQREEPLADAGSHAIAAVERGLSSGEQCATISAAATFSGVPYAYSPGSYDPSGCNKAYVVDLTSRASSEYFTGTYVSWFDYRVPTTQSECEDIRVSAYVWDKTSGSPIYLGARSKAGVWNGACETPTIRIEDLITLQDGKNYRFAVQARNHASGSYQTRKVAVTNVPVWSNGIGKGFSTPQAGRAVATAGSVAVVGGTDEVHVLELQADGSWQTAFTEEVSEGGGVAARSIGYYDYVAWGDPASVCPVSEFDAGEVTVYRRNPFGSGWELYAKRCSPYQGALFGKAVALDEQANGHPAVLVGAPGAFRAFYYSADSTDALPSQPTREWASTTTVAGFALAVAGQYPYAFIGSPNDKEVKVFDVGSPSFSATLTSTDAETFVGPPPTGSFRFDNAFGLHLAAVPGRVFVGSSFAVYEFSQAGNSNWIEQPRSIASPYPGIDSLAANADSIFIGDDYSANSGSATGGAVVQYRKMSDSRWYPIHRFVARSLPSPQFGSAVSATDSRLLVGASADQVMYSYDLPIPCDFGPQCERPLLCDEDGDCGMPLMCSLRRQGHMGGVPAMHVCIPDGCGGDSVCSEDCKCPVGGLGCDDDDECQEGLTCVDNLGNLVGVPKSMSVCVSPECEDRVQMVPGSAEYCSVACPCGTGMGHCDSDDECMRGLKCKSWGTRFGYSSSVKVCVEEHCTNGVQDEAEDDVDCGGFACGRCPGCPAFTPGLGSEFCEDDCPCDIGLGDCDGDSTCRPYTTDFDTSVTVQCKTDYGAYYGLPSGWEVCERSDCDRSTSPHNNPGHSSYCSEECPCAAGFGDCDSDDPSEPWDCLNGLTCVTNVGPKFGMGPEHDVCLPAHCADGVKDDDETDIDCGNSCGGCDNGLDCGDNVDCWDDLDGDGDNDVSCLSGVCGIAHCFNGVIDGGEVGQDCGGIDCVGCQLGGPCDDIDGCATGLACLDGLCWPDHCSNGILDGGETAADCGGDCPGICGEGAGCGDDSDCVGPLVCEYGRCVNPPDCSGATCADPVDGRGIHCPGVCEDGEIGCQSDVNCLSDYICVPVGGGVGVCRPSECGRFSVAAVNCGFPGAVCGDCLDTFAICQDRECGTDPNTGANCGTCGVDNFCNIDGQCTMSPDDPPVLVPSPGGPRPIVDLAEPTTATEVGVVAGQFSVTDRGSASYEIPIEVPPGRAGMEPALSLQYTGTRINGPLGIGWALNGLGSITRCPKTIAMDGVNSPVTNTQTDRYCLDGQPLRVTSVNGTTTEYATVPDTFAKVQSFDVAPFDFHLPGLSWVVPVDPAQRGPVYFRVWTKDGKILTYGATQDSSLLTRDDRRIGWLVSKVEDRSGNNVLISYLNTLESTTDWLWENTPGVALPSVVAYTGHGSDAGNREVRFEYEERPDQVVGFQHGGLPMVSPVRLRRLTTYVKGDPVLSYKVEYVAGLTSQLEKVSKCVGDGDNCTLPTTFRYGEDTGFEFTDPLDPTHQLGTWQAYQLDMDGNGIADLLQTQLIGFTSPNNGLVSAVQKTSNLANDIGSELIPFPYGAIASFAYYFISPSFFGVFTDKPKPIYGQFSALSNGSRVHPPYALNTNVSGLTGTCFGSTGDLAFDYANNVFTDVNQDGRDDVVFTCSQGGIFSNDKIWSLEWAMGDGGGDFLHTGAGSSPETLKDLFSNPLYLSVAAIPAEDSDKIACNVGGCGPVESPGPLPLMYDADGDGIDDLIACEDSETVAFYPGLPFVQGAGHFGNRTQIQSLGYYCRHQDPAYVIVDADGDGVNDLLTRGQDDWGVLRRVDGDFEWIQNVLPDVGLSSYGKDLKTGDFNGDGLADVWGSNGAFGIIWLNTGTGVFVARHVYKGDQATTAGFAPTDYQRTIILDYNGDGRSDILELWDKNGGLQGGDPVTFVYSTDASVSLLLPLGQEPSPFEDMTIRAPGALYSDHWTQAVDMDGDGSLDLLSTSSPTQAHSAIHYGKTALTHLLTSVVDGVGKSVDIEYDPDAYTKEISCEATRPARCVPRMTAIVSAHVEGIVDGQLPERRYEYRYLNGIADPTGSGFLGFQHREIEEYIAQSGQSWASRGLTTLEYEELQAVDDQGTPIAGTTYGVHHYPLAGKVKVETVERLPVQNALTGGSYSTKQVVTNTWGIGLSSRNTIFPKLIARDAGTWDTAISTSSTTLVSQVSDTFVTDGYGNVTSHGSSTVTELNGPECSNENVTANYDISEGAWLISNPSSITVTRHQGDDVAPSSWNPTAYSETQNWTLGYDPEGRLISVTRAPGTSAEHRTTYDLDQEGYGNVVVTTEEVNTGELPRITAVGYDADHIFPLTVETVRETPSPLSLVHQVRFDPRFGAIKTLADPNGITSQYSYDAFGRLAEVREPEGIKELSYERIVYPDENVPLTGIVIRPLVAVTTTTSGLQGTPGGVSVEEVDAYGRTVRTRTSGLLGIEVRQEHEFDYAGRLVRSTLPHSDESESIAFTEISYDELDRVVQESRYESSISSPNFVSAKVHEYASQVSLAPGHASWLDNKKCTIGAILSSDELGKKDAVVVGPRGEVLRNFDGENWDAPIPAEYSNYTYDAGGRLVRMTDRAGNNTIFDYDAYGRRLSMDDPDADPEVFTHNGFDEVKTSSRTGLMRTYFYDELGRQVSLEDDDGMTTKVTSWVYDSGINALGRLVEALSPGTAEYPGGQRLAYAYEDPTATENRGAVQQITNTLDGDDYVVAFTYDDLSRLATVEYPNGTSDDPIVVEYEYDPSGMMDTLKEVGSGTPRTLWQLNEAFEGFAPKQETFGNGAVTEYAYEGTRHWLASLSTTIGTATPLDQAYQYNPNGQLFLKVDADPGRGTMQYSYDALHRLRVEDHVGGVTLVYDYDSLGNLTAKHDLGSQLSKFITYSPTAPHQVDDAFGNVYTYSATGNVSSRVGADVPGGSQTFTYTPFDLPSVVTTGTGGAEEVTRFEYDAMESRVVERRSTTTQYSVEGLYRATTTGSGLDEEVFKLFAGGRAIGEIRRTGGQEEIFYFHQDLLGSVDTITDEQGQFERQKFEPFGARVNPSGEEPRDGFTGHEHDQDLGLIDMKGRSYDPLTGRFLSPDPIAQAPFWSQGLNRYSYVFNDPLNLIDPSGFSAALCCSYPTGSYAGGTSGAAGATGGSTYFPGFGTGKLGGEAGKALRKKLLDPKNPRTAPRVPGIRQSAGGASGKGDPQSDHSGGAEGQSGDGSPAAGYIIDGVPDEFFDIAGILIPLPTPQKWLKGGEFLAWLVKVAGARRLESSVAALAKGAKFFERFVNRNPFDQSVRQVGRFTEFAVSVPGRVKGSFTRWVKVVNQEGRTIHMYHDTFDKTGKFIHRGWKQPVRGHVP